MSAFDRVRSLFIFGTSKDWRMGAPDRVRSLFVPFANGHTEHTQNQSLIIACSPYVGVHTWACVASAFVACLCGSAPSWLRGLCGLGIRCPPVWLHGT